MKPHPRIRKTIKWGGAAVTVLLVVVWIGSGWRTWTGHLGGGLLIWSGHGLVSLKKLDAADIFGIRQGLRLGNAQYPFEMQWGFYWWSNKPFVSWEITIPIWAVTVVLLTATALAWRLDTLARRRAKLNRCAKCGYDRTGLSAGAVCPECGRTPA